jgi:Uma2 family endonuclease
MAPVKKPGTYADILALPEHLVGELLDGELIVSPRPRALHALVSSGLGAELGGPFQRGRNGPGGWWILDEPELHLGRDVLVPDLAGWRRERMLEVLDVPYFTLAPDWVCEILSPSTAKVDLERKLPKYARAEVSLAWVISPQLRALEVLRRKGAAWLLEAAFSGDEAVRAVPFDAVPLELGALWPTPTPEPPSGP